MASRIDVSQAVQQLAELALGDNGFSAEAAAQVLLSCWRGYDYHISAADLCNLENDYLEAALIVLRSRAQDWSEPQTVIVDGDAVFSLLAKKWKYLKNRERYTDLYRSQAKANGV
ncbi:hypothetical protein KCM76_20740 [Zooshikella marina]|uniref:DUF7673 family protein n=1 Tax=Zooshikella ganghwensis TaxID=202772 RepID=UPI001BB011AD|nr:hypothetical protein [Zooshikella ganghwensis]MBU2708433.1 hypothetical protein [Zooshikella ganghwensis]